MGFKTRTPWLGEISPWSNPETLHRLTFLRGAILANYAYVEQMITEAALRVSRVEPYGALRPDLPVQHSDRATFLLEVAEADGPLARHGRIIQLFIERFRASAALRHQMAHAHISAIGTHEVWISATEITRRSGRSPVLMSSARLDLAALEQGLERAIKLARLAQQLRDRCDRDGLLPTLDPI